MSCFSMKYILAPCFLLLLKKNFSSAIVFVFPHRVLKLNFSAMLYLMKHKIPVILVLFFVAVASVAEFALQKEKKNL